MAEIPFDPEEIVGAIELAVVEDLIEVGELTAQALVFTTPVGKPELWANPPPADYTPGHARYNWRVAIGQPILAEREGVDPGGGATVAEMRTIIRGINSIDAQLNFTFTIPYGRRLNNGWSTQAPVGYIEQATIIAQQTASQNRREI